MKPYGEETFKIYRPICFSDLNQVRQTDEDDEALALDHQFYMLHGHFAYHNNDFLDLKTTLICSKQKNSILMIFYHFRSVFFHP